MEPVKSLASDDSSMAETTDKRVGAGVLLGVLSVAAALGMYVSQTEQTTAWAFAAAVALAALAVASFHVYE